MNSISQNTPIKNCLRMTNHNENFINHMPQIIVASKTNSRKNNSNGKKNWTVCLITHLALFDILRYIFSEHKDYFVEWTIKTSADTDRDELEKIAKYIEQERVVDENITIKFVRVGSIVIGTLIPANVVDNSDVFNQTVRRFIRIIIDKCKFNTKFEHILKIDVSVKPSSECKLK